jgi:flagellar basal body rod protein FlgG
LSYYSHRNIRREFHRNVLFATEAREGSAIALNVPVGIMDALTIAAASGLNARIESLDLLANNIANQSAAGYKADREFYGLYASSYASGLLDPSSPALSPIVEKQWTDFSQGTLTPTGNPLDVAISGRGFFQVEGPEGALYTRGGNFHRSPTGTLETQEGYAVLDRAGKPVRLNPALSVEIGSRGEITQDKQPAGQLQIVDFDRPDALAKRNGTYFQPADGMQSRSAPDATVHQGTLEAANGSPADSAVRLVGVLRQFEMLQKAIQIGSEMSKRGEEIARAGS